MKAKPPFQILVLDDDGRELYTGYISLDQQPTALNVNDVGGEQNLLLTDLQKAITNPTIDKTTSQWFTM